MSRTELYLTPNVLLWLFGETFETRDVERIASYAQPLAEKDDIFIARIIRGNWEVLPRRNPRLVRLKLGLLPSERAFKRIMVAVDGSESSLRAGKYAVNLAKRDEADLIVVSVVHMPSHPSIGSLMKRRRPRQVERYYAQVSKSAEQWTNRIVALAEGAGVNVRVRIPKGKSIVKSITDYGKREEADLIIVGRKGTGGFKRLLLGSVSNGLLNHAACTVLVVR